MSEVIRVSAERLRKLIRYEPLFGRFTWLIQRAYVVFPGDEAGYVRTSMCGHLEQKYRVIEIDGCAYKAHQLAWLYMTGEWPSKLVDHRDCDSLNNSWENLRLATSSQNKANSFGYQNNKLGIKGVSQRGKRYIARIRVDGKLLYLGRFSSVDEASAAYAAAAKRHFGEFARFAA